jgi:hypothetical protein
LKTLFLAWEDPGSGSWFPIGRLTFNGKEYQFNYTNGVLEAKLKCGFGPLPSFPDFNKVYTSQKLFPLFSNRVMPRSRPDYPEFVQWLNIPQHEDDPIALLARSGGKRVTDKFEVFPCPEPDENGRYRIHFFAHGLRHLPKPAIERINGLQVGELLYLAHEFQNPHDSSALLLCTEDHWIVGYCPRYLCGGYFSNYLAASRIGSRRSRSPQPTPNAATVPLAVQDDRRLARLSPLPRLEVPAV